MKLMLMQMAYYIVRVIVAERLRVLLLLLRGISGGGGYWCCGMKSLIAHHFISIIDIVTGIMISVRV